MNQEGFYQTSVLQTEIDDPSNENRNQWIPFIPQDNHYSNNLCLTETIEEE